MNAARSKMFSEARELAQQSRAESRKPNSVYIPPTKRAVDSLHDYVADNSDLKHSRAFQRLLDAYHEATLHSLQS